MPAPWKHPKTNVYYYRKVVPASLRKAVGQTEFRISLGTKDLRVAKLKYLDAAARVDAQLAQAANGPGALTQQQVSALAGLWYRRELRKYEAEPGNEAGWDAWETSLVDAGHEGKTPDEVKSAAAELLKTEGLAVDQPSRARLEEAIHSNAIQLANLLQQRAGGDYSPDPLTGTIPEWKSPLRTKQDAPETFTGLFEAWKAERRPPPRTEYEWERVLGRLQEHVGHDDPLRLTKADVVKWKDALVASGKAPKTVKQHILAVHALFNWCVRNERMKLNPASGVHVAMKDKPSQRRLPYSEDDARLLLIAARKEKGARRWVPWLLAFTGARLQEVCQCHVKDVRQEGKVWFLDINQGDEGKSLKNAGSARKVPLHPALIREGFIEYVRTLKKDGPLLPDLTPDRFGRRGGNGTKIIGRWVRDKGITDKRKAPSHAWRHRFKDQCRDAGIPKDVHDALTGHRSGDEGDKYGVGHGLPILAKAIAKLRSPVG